MKETTKSYDWITACVMMREGKFMLSEGNLVYRVVDNKVEVYSNSDSVWVPTEITKFRQQLAYTVCEDPSTPKYTPCTWQEACALRVFTPSGDTNIKYNGRYWCTAFAMCEEFKSGKFEMLTKLYNEHFKGK